MITRLAAFRKLMVQKGIEAYVLPRTDQYQSEYLAPSDERVAFMSGFTGSHAIALICQQKARLYTDGRYWIQAQQQLEEGWELGKIKEEEKKWFQYAAEIYPKGSAIGFDPRLMTATAAIERSQYFEKKGMTLKPLTPNLVDHVWQERPKEVRKPIFCHQEWAGRSIIQKVGWVRDKIASGEAFGAVFAELSQIAWILNLRSSQIPHNPFFKSILVITKTGGKLYLSQDHPSFNDLAMRQHLSKVDIQVKKQQPQFENIYLANKGEVNYEIYRSISKPLEWEGIGNFRAIRTQKQLDGFRRCHLADAVAMAKFWAWRSDLESVGEYEAAMEMDRLRREQPLNQGTSFDTISGAGANGAIIHYRPEKGKDQKATKQMIHLVDSGGQYLDGTTDVTRAFHFGVPTSEQKEAYTRVLLGNLDLERLKWPVGRVTGAHIDVLARRHLWSSGLDYMHGTGHGVGHFLSVHEGPVGISHLSKTILKDGMIVTNEPGYYKEGHFGIRIENMLIVRQEQGWNHFEVLTLCPYDRNLIELRMLSTIDRQHIDMYHKRVWQEVSPFLNGDEKALNWLRSQTVSLA